MTERIALHLTVYLTDRGTMNKFRNRWRHMPEGTRDRFRDLIRVSLAVRPRADSL